MFCIIESWGLPDGDVVQKQTKKRSSPTSMKSPKTARTVETQTTVAQAINDALTNTANQQRANQLKIYDVDSSSDDDDIDNDSIANSSSVSSLFELTDFGEKKQKLINIKKNYPQLLDQSSERSSDADNEINKKITLEKIIEKFNLITEGGIHLKVDNDSNTLTVTDDLCRYTYELK